MSLALFLASTDGGSIDLSPGSGKFDDFSPSDELIQTMRPDGVRLARFVVAPNGSPLRKTHTNISAAVNEAVALQSSSGGAHPDRRVDVWVTPGSYPGHINLQPWVCLYAEPGSVNITTTNDSGLGTIDSGGEVYVEGLNFFRNPYVGEGSSPTNPKYPLHHTARRTSVFADCLFNTSAPASGGYPSAMGADVPGATTTVFYKCGFETSAAQQLATNFHGWPDNVEPLTVVYAKCHSNGELNHNTLGSNQADNAWFVDNAAYGIRVLGSSTMVRMFGNTLSQPAELDGATYSESASWPVPVGCLSEEDRSLYYAT